MGVHSYRQLVISDHLTSHQQKYPAQNQHENRKTHPFEQKKHVFQTSKKRIPSSFSRGAFHTNISKISFRMAFSASLVFFTYAKFDGHTVDGRNPAPPGMYKTL